MPITASMGALTYARTALDANFTYWAMQLTGVASASPIVDLIPDQANNNIFVINSVSNSPNLCKINTGTNLTNPTGLAYNKNYTFSSGLFTGTPSYVGKAGIEPVTNYITLGMTLNWPYTPTAPFYTVGSPFVLYLQKADGLVNSKSSWKWPQNIPPTFTLEDYANINKVFFDSTGRIYLLTKEETNPPVVTSYRYASGGVTTRNGGITISPNPNVGSINDTWITGLVNGIDQPVTLSQMTSGLRIYTNNSTAGVAPTYTQTTIYRTELDPASGTITGIDLQLDALENRIIICNGSTSTRGYIYKMDLAHNFVWQRQITSVTLGGTYIDASSNIYVAGVDTSNRLWIAKYNSAGVIQWQNRMTASVGNFSSVKINGDTAGGLIIAALVNNTTTVFRLPQDGSIPGTGTYYYPGGTYTYVTASLTDSAGTLIASTPVNTAGGVNTSSNFTNGVSTPIVNNSTSIVKNPIG
jgi:hypothetical protein